MIFNNKLLKKFLLPIGIVLALHYSTIHAIENQSIHDIAGRVQSNILSVAKLLVVLSYCAGVGFAMAGILQFKAHKDNPTQTPLSKPLVYLAVAGFLLFLPAVMGSAGKTIFGSKAGTTAAEGISNITTVTDTPTD